YEHWRHEHVFAEVAGGVEVRDRVAYSLPLSPLSDVALPLARRDLKRIFDFRRAIAARVLAA
ncbi:MAG: hypothetical protein JO293_06005, partial [Candidatus Eremiobacteraeota bacterium]|nr:hypothetical protein [Candidatus Eremiobacteraeota bacterium]